MAVYDYDLLSIGSGPAGFHAAIQAATVGRRAAVVERRDLLGGACVNSGTIPSKTLREAALPFASNRRHLLVEEGYRPPTVIDMTRLVRRIAQVVEREHRVITEELRRNGIDLLTGEAAFRGPHTIVVRDAGGRERELSAESVVLAVGTQPRRPSDIPFDDRSIVDSDGILKLDRAPRSLAVIGGGVIGCEYASIFASLGVRVTLIDSHSTLLSFMDDELVAQLLAHLRRDQQITLHLGEQVAGVVPLSSSVQVRIDPITEQVDCVLYCAGRIAETASLNLETIGLKLNDADGHLKVDQDYRTSVPWVFAAGDVIGFPSLASTSMEQGRVAACRALGVAGPSLPAHFPLGIYTIPELSMVGSTEQSLKASGTAYETGRASYEDVARGQIIGDPTGSLKLLFDPETRQLLGVHVIGEGATELVHLGQAVMNLGGTLDYLRDAVFNYPTLAEAYKVAALDGFSRLRGK